MMRAYPASAEKLRLAIIQLQAKKNAAILPEQDKDIEYSTVFITPNTDLNLLDCAEDMKPKGTILNRITVDSGYYAEALEDCLIDIDKQYDEPPTCMEIIQAGEYFPLGTLGNFSMILGKAKSRKTFAASMMLAAAVSRTLLMNTIKVSLPSKQSVVALFDTEQGNFKVHEVVQRVFKLANVDQTDNFLAYGLRGKSTQDRINLIEYAIYNTPNLGLVVIDGIRDLVTSINDEQQATMITSKLMKWTEDKNIHIIVILHQNKNDANARGHLGTELTNKSETVIGVSRDIKNENVSVLTGLFCRNKEFHPCAFSIDEQGLPYFNEDWTPKKDGGKKQTKPTPLDIPNDVHSKILADTFRINSEPQWKVLISELKVACIQHGCTYGENKTLELLKFYQDQKMISCSKPVGKRYSLYSLTPPL